MKNLFVIILLLWHSNLLLGQKICIDKFVPKTDDQDAVYEIGLLKGLVWENGQTLKIAFIGGDDFVINKIKHYAEEWTQYANIKFSYVNSLNESDIRISFTPGGSWSYIGRDALSIAKHLPTLNFGWFDRSTSEPEFRRTTLHEFGHALGAIHEHQHPEGGINWNKPAVYSYYMNPPNNWSRQQVDRNIFQKYSVDQFVLICPYDMNSIMHYPIPQEFTLDNYSVGWNTSLSQLDKDAIKELYPKLGQTSRFWTDAEIRFDRGGWLLGDYNGDGKCDVLRQGILDAHSIEVFLSTGEKFMNDGKWARPTIHFSKGGIVVGDYNGDEKDDFLRYGVKDEYEIEVFLSNGTGFVSDGKWARPTIHFNKGGIVVGDYNGDGKDDFLRYGVKDEYEVEVFLSNGTGFVSDGKWARPTIHFSKGGIVVGDYNGDGKDDFLRYGVKDEYEIEVFLSNGTGFVSDGKWAKPLIEFDKGGFFIGDFHGDGKDDFFRYRPFISSAEVFYSTGSNFVTGSTCRD
jgi:sRNA-binding regulator protein Hfq